MTEGEQDGRQAPGTDSPGRNPRRRLHGPARPLGQCAGKGAGRARHPNLRHCAGSSWDHGGHRPAARSLPRNESGAVDGPAVGVRPACRAAGERRDHRAEGLAAAPLRRLPELDRSASYRALGGSGISRSVRKASGRSDTRSPPSSATLWPSTMRLDGGMIQYLHCGRQEIVRPSWCSAASGGAGADGGGGGLDPEPP